MVNTLHDDYSNLNAMIRIRANTSFHSAKKINENTDYVLIKMFVFFCKTAATLHNNVN